VFLIASMMVCPRFSEFAFGDYWSGPGENKWQKVPGIFAGSHRDDCARYLWLSLVRVFCPYPHREDRAWLRRML